MSDSPTLTWVTCSMEVHSVVGLERHLIVYGQPTTLCGSTGLPVSVWRRNSKKPKCPTCVAAAPGES